MVRSNESLSGINDHICQHKLTLRTVGRDSDAHAIEPNDTRSDLPMALGRFGNGSIEPSICELLMIVGVAFYNKETQMLVTLPKPHRHNDIIALLYEETGRQVKANWTQGFVSHAGVFLNRQQAAKYVLEREQPLTDYAKAEYENRTLTTLFSEDLW